MMSRVPVLRPQTRAPGLLVHDAIAIANGYCEQMWFILHRMRSQWDLLD